MPLPSLCFHLLYKMQHIISSLFCSVHFVTAVGGAAFGCLLNSRNYTEVEIKKKQTYKANIFKVILESDFSFSNWNREGGGRSKCGISSDFLQITITVSCKSSKDSLQAALLYAVYNCMVEQCKLPTRLRMWDLVVGCACLMPTQLEYTNHGGRLQRTPGNFLVQTPLPKGSEAGGWFTTYFLKKTPAKETWMWGGLGGLRVS